MTKTVEQIDQQIAAAREEYVAAMKEYVMARQALARSKVVGVQRFPYKERYQALEQAIAQGRLVWKG